MRGRVQLTALMLFWMLGCRSYHEIKSKEEYAVLQGIELEQRARSISDVVIVEQGGYRAAGFVPESGSEEVWVLLNTRYRPYYKQIPQGPFRIQQRDFETIRQTAGVRKDVLAELERRVSPAR